MSPAVRSRRKSGESGFAMLLVFLMAAVIAISLYIQIPRVAFDAQRQKEQLLMERGEQYKRAIQLFVRANGRYPSKVDDLENFNNRRFLRHKFKDPITGKDEWRLIHINAAGVFTDSITNKPKQDDKNQSISTPSSIAEMADLGAVPGQGQQTVTSAAGRRRASEGGTAPVLGPDGQPVQAQYPGVAGVPGGQPYPGQPGQPYPGQPYPGQPYPGQPNAGGPQQVEQNFQPPTAPPDPANPSGQPGFALTTPNPQMANNLPQGAGGPVPPEVANLPGGGQPGQPAQAGQPVTYRPPVPVQQPNPNLGNQSPTGSSSIGGVSSIGGSSSSIGGVSSVGSNTSSLGGGVPGQNGAYNPNTNYVPPSSQYQQQVNQYQQQVSQANPAFPAGGQANFQTPGAGLGQPNTQTANAGGGFGQPNTQPANPATSMINNMLTTPRQTPTGTGTGTTATGPGGQTIGGGIAGVASTSESASIMIYHDRSKYNEWEFIFDYTKQPALPSVNGGVAGTPAQNLASPQGNAATPNAGVGNTSSFGGGSPFGNSGVGNNSGIGNSGFGNSGFGNNSGTGQQGTGSPTQQQAPPTDIRLGQP
jgi:hypothetical protein